jgi:hypothetical protein
MKRSIFKLILVCFLFSYDLVGQNIRTDYLSRVTTIGNLDSDDDTQIKEMVYISINETTKKINLNFIGQANIMSLGYSDKKYSNEQYTFILNENKWLIQNIVLLTANNIYTLCFLYASPNRTVWFFGPLEKQ